MNPKPYLILSGTIFGLVCLLHLVRSALVVPVVAGGHQVPLWISWVGAVGAGVLSGWAFYLARGPRSPQTSAGQSS
jgi:hypothetical protein